VGELSDDGPALLSYGLRVNGRRYEVSGAELCESLLYALRERLGLRGPKKRLPRGRVRVVLGAHRRRPRMRLHSPRRRRR